MLSSKMQSAINGMGQVDILLEMITHYLVNRRSDESWCEKMEHALYLLEDTYHGKKTDILSAISPSFN